MLRRSPVGVVLHRLGGGVALGGAATQGPKVEVTGRAGELLLFCFGRQAHARVEYAGEPESITRLKNAGFAV